MTIDVIPDDVLVEIFSFYVNIDCPRWYTPRNTWHALVHVCRRWRYLVFASPRHLDLRLGYCGHVPLSEVPDAWPVLPVILKTSVSELRHPKFDQWWDNRFATLESKHHNRICEIHFPDLPCFLWERFAAAMQKSFPELTHLEVSVRSGMVPVLPDSFLGGSAPRLRELWLTRFPFPSMPKLLLSANGLVKLFLWDIPDSGYISPDAMATSLTAMTRLETLYLGFNSPPPIPASQPLPPPTRIVLPALTKLVFGGVYEYLEDLLARIDPPLLYDLSIVFFMVLDFDVLQLHRFIGHAEAFKTFTHADVLIFDDSIRLALYPKTAAVDHRRLLTLQVNCGELSWQLLSLARLCSSSFPLISTLEELKIREPEDPMSLHWKDDMENAQWLELLDPFTSLKSLYLTHEIAQRVCGALQELSGERATEVLPSLRNLFVRGFSSLQHVQEAMMPFVAARQLSGHPMVVDGWKD